MLLRLPRSSEQVLRAVERLDKAALTSRRREVNAAMVRAALADDEAPLS
jgi:hypothetical protein